MGEMLGTMNIDKPQRLNSDMRGVRYGEVVAVYFREENIEAEVYGTQMLNDCPAELWDTLVAEDIAKELEAVFVKLNGPRHWMLDGLGTKVNAMEPVLREFNGLLMRRIAVIRFPPGDRASALPYEERFVDRGAQFYFDEGSVVYELVNPEGKAYVMQAYCLGVDAGMTQDSLASLGERLAMPEGWSYRSRILDEELLVDTTGNMATVIQDEFENTYTLPY
jgi:hypothetical protein